MKTVFLKIHSLSHTIASLSLSLSLMHARTHTHTHTHTVTHTHSHTVTLSLSLTQAAVFLHWNLEADEQHSRRYQPCHGCRKPTSLHEASTHVWHTEGTETHHLAEPVWKCKHKHTSDFCDYALSVKNKCYSHSYMSHGGVWMKADDFFLNMYFMLIPAVSHVSQCRYCLLVQFRLLECFKTNVFLWNNKTMSSLSYLYTACRSGVENGTRKPSSTPAARPSLATTLSADAAERVQVLGKHLYITCRSGVLNSTTHG